MQDYFAQLVGQREAVERLKRMLSNEWVPHGLMFCGPFGVGKATAARLFAAALIRTPPDRLERTAGFIHITPETSFGVDLIRDQVIPFFSLRRDGWRVAVLDGAERMTREAANALLKTLEEPPPRSLIVLVVMRPEELPSTISSRCVSVPFSRLTFEQTVDVLCGVGVVREMAEKAAILSAGSPGFALQLIDDDLLAVFADAVETLLTGRGCEEAVVTLLRKVKRRERMVEMVDGLVAAVSSREGSRCWDVLQRLQRLHRDISANLNVGLAVSAIFGGAK